MAAEKMKEILKHFPDLENGWKEMEEKLKAEPAERERPETGLEGHKDH